MQDKKINLEEIREDIDGLYLATELFISQYLKNEDINILEILSLTAEELDKISSKLETYEMKNIFSQDENEILDIPSMQNKKITNSE